MNHDKERTPFLAIDDCGRMWSVTAIDHDGTVHVRTTCSIAPTMYGGWTFIREAPLAPLVFDTEPVKT